MKSVEIDEAVAAHLARIHSLEMPISKKPRFLQMLLKMFTKGIKEYQNDPKIKPAVLNEEQREVVKVLSKVNLKEEVVWLEAHLDKLNSRVVFSHNDAHSLNLIFKKDCKNMIDRIMYLDFELSTYNYRGYDLAHYINLRNYHICDGPFDLDKHKPPSQEVKEKFLLSYLKEWKAVGQFDPSIDNFEHLKQELQLLTLLDDFLLFFGCVECVKQDFIFYPEYLVTIIIHFC